MHHGDKTERGLRTVNRRMRRDSRLDLALTNGEDSKRESHCTSLDTLKTRRKRGFEAHVKSDEHDRTATEHNISCELQEGNSPKKRKKDSAVRDDTISNKLTESSLEEEGKNLEQVLQLCWFVRILPSHTHLSILIISKRLNVHIHKKFLQTSTSHVDQNVITDSLRDTRNTITEYNIHRYNVMEIFVQVFKLHPQAIKILSLCRSLAYAVTEDS